MIYHLIYPLYSYFAALNVFRYITFRTIYATLTALLISVVIAPWFIRKVSQYELKQYIRKDGPPSHQKKAGTPTMGGIFILFSVIISVLFWADLGNPFVWLLLFVAVTFGLIGFVDDFLSIRRQNSKGLSARTRLICEFLLALGVGVFLYFEPSYNTQLSVPFFKEVRPDLGVGYIFLTAFIIVGFSNAVNLTDGLDGLAIGPYLIAISTYLVLSYLAGHVKIAEYLQIPFISNVGEATVVCGALVGASVGFLWFNAYPAQIFMGDVGALPLGALLGTVAILVKHEILLVLVGGIFVLETVSVIMQVGFFKATNGRRIFRMAPVHHHFELKGWPEPKVIVRFWIIAAILSLMAISTLKLR
ncbi:MAG: phospho-N-acetylmuramoyl-pentapeptide-transferase [Deltaproteobacteria bacterium]|nr:phospho-N-acetylmuramoyl-pentapeptide-transferase [Deltaproteobacteria bacterium]